MSISAGLVKQLRDKTGVGFMECKKALTESQGDVEKAMIWLRENGLKRAAKKADRIAAEGLVMIANNDNRSAAGMVELNCETDFASKTEEFTNFAKELAKAVVDNKATSVAQVLEIPTGSETFGDKLTHLIAKIGENMKLRRVAYLEADQGIIGSYIHMGGKVGSMVALKGASQGDHGELAEDLALHVTAISPKYLNSSSVDQSELDQERNIAKKQLLDQGKPADMVDKILVGQMNKFYKEICFEDQVFFKDSKTPIKKLVADSGNISISSFHRFGLGEGIEKKVDNFAEEVANLAK